VTPALVTPFQVSVAMVRTVKADRREVLDVPGVGEDDRGVQAQRHHERAGAGEAHGPLELLDLAERLALGGGPLVLPVLRVAHHLVEGRPVGGVAGHGDPAGHRVGLVGVDGAGEGVQRRPLEVSIGLFGAGQDVHCPAADAADGGGVDRGERVGVGPVDVAAAGDDPGAVDHRDVIEVGQQALQGLGQATDLGLLGVAEVTAALEVLDTGADGIGLAEDLAGTGVGAAELVGGTEDDGGLGHGVTAPQEKGEGGTRSDALVRPALLRGDRGSGTRWSQPRS
jgi:hypothetical protein